MKGSGWFLKPPPSSFVPFTFPFLSQLSVCLCVSRVRAYLTTNQHLRPANTFYFLTHNLSHARKYVSATAPLA